MELTSHDGKGFGLHPEPNTGGSPEPFSVAQPEKRAFEREAPHEDLADAGQERTGALGLAKRPQQLRQDGSHAGLGQGDDRLVGAHARARRNAGHLGSGGRGLVPLHGGHGEREPLSVSLERSA
jgi:hypothetical protein